MKRKCYTYRLSVTRVLVSFLQRFNADSNRSGSSLRNFSARTTISISELNRPFIPSCKLGNRTFRSATVLLKYSVYYNQQDFSDCIFFLYRRVSSSSFSYLDLLIIKAMFSTSDMFTLVFLFMTLPRSSSTVFSSSLQPLKDRC